MGGFFSFGPEGEGGSSLSSNLSFQNNIVFKEILRYSYTIAGLVGHILLTI